MKPGFPCISPLFSGANIQTIFPRFLFSLLTYFGG